MTKILRPALLAAALTTTLGVSLAAQAASPALKTEKAKASYVVGMDLAAGIPPIVRQELNPALVAKALETVLAGHKPAIGQAEYKTVRQQFMKKLQAKFKLERAAKAKKNAAEGTKFLKANKSKPGVKVLADGLQYKVIKMGTGPKPTKKDTVQIDYSGSLVNGTVFDSSAKHGGPASIPLANVIAGFRKGVEMMPVGSHFKLYIPSTLGYGATPPPGPIAPNATLIFDIKLLKIIPVTTGNKSAGK